MKHDYTSVKNIYIICGKTDMRKGIDGLATLIQDSFELDPYRDSLFLFSGWSKDRYKCLYFDGDGFALLYKHENEVRNLSQQEIRWLLEGVPSAKRGFTTLRGSGCKNSRFSPR